MTKKIIPIASLVLIGLIVVAVIVLALIPKSFAPNIGNPARIEISGTSSRIFSATDANDKEIYDKILEAYNKTFTESALNALFQGRLCKNAEGKYQEDTLTYLSSLSDYLRFDYNEDKTINIQEKDVTYRSIAIEMNDNNGMYEVKVYLLQTSGSTSTNYYISAIGDLGNLVTTVSTIKTELN